MIIGFDAKRVVSNYTGLGNYSRFVVDILSFFYPQNNYLLFAPKVSDSPFIQKYQNENVSFRFPQTFLGSKFSSLWRTKGVVKDLKRNNVMLYHGLSGEIPSGIHQSGIKSVVTIHDLIFMRYPKFYHWIDRKIYEKKFRYAVRYSDRVIAVSECTKRDIIQYFGVSPEKVEVVYQGCHNSFAEPHFAEQRKTIRQNYELPERYLLYVGSIEERKNLLLVVQALQKLPEEVKLVAVGKVTPYLDLIKDYLVEHKLEHRVHFLHNVPFIDLPVIYQMASVFIYPSFFEGFGIPVLEALQSGVPVIAATGSCLEEAGGPYSLYIDPTSMDEMIEAIHELWGNAEKVVFMVEKGKEYAKRFSDEKLAADLMAVYQKVMQ